MRISDWSSDVCASVVLDGFVLHDVSLCSLQTVEIHPVPMRRPSHQERKLDARNRPARNVLSIKDQELRPFLGEMGDRRNQITITFRRIRRARRERSEEHTSELQSLMRISYAVFCL